MLSSLFNKDLDLNKCYQLNVYSFWLCTGVFIYLLLQVLAYLFSKELFSI